MAFEWLAKTADEFENTFVAFDDDGVNTGQMSYLEAGPTAIEAGIFGVVPGEFPDRSPVFHTVPADEYFFVVEGTVRLESEGKTTVLSEGAAAFFPKGHTGTWTFEAPFRKFSIQIGEDGK